LGGWFAASKTTFRVGFVGVAIKIDIGDRQEKKKIRGDRRKRSLQHIRALWFTHRTEWRKMFLSGQGNRGQSLTQRNNKKGRDITSTS